MELDSRLSHLIAKYKKSLERNPSSHVFAPLSECYRKAGMINDAFLTLRDGLHHNPDFVLGHIVLAQCYLDQGQFQKVYEVLGPLRSANLENIKLQRLYAQACLKLEKNAEALESYKYILFLNPTNQEAIEVVRSLEDDVYKNFSPVEDENSSFEKFPIEKIEEVDPLENDADGWEALNFIEGPDRRNVKSEADDDKSDSWSMESISEDVFDHEMRSEREQENNFFHADPIDEERSFQIKADGQDPIQTGTPEKNEEEKRPLITHTLVDLYCAQGHYEQAYYLLKKILELNPEDEKTVQKMKEVQEFIDFEDAALEKEHGEDLSEAVDEQTDEEQAHENLANLVESRLQISKRSKVAEVEQRLWAFHEKLCGRSKDLRS